MFTQKAAVAITISISCHACTFLTNNSEYEYEVYYCNISKVAITYQQTYNEYKIKCYSHTITVI